MHRPSDMYWLQAFRNFCRCAFSIQCSFLFLALSANPTQAEDSDGSCLPQCTVFQNDKAISEIGVEIRRLEKLSADQRKKLNQLNNELSVEKYNARRAQFGTRITTTQKDLSIAEVSVGRLDRSNALKEIQEKIDDVVQSLNENVARIERLKVQLGLHEKLEPTIDVRTIRDSISRERKIDPRNLSDVDDDENPIMEFGQFHGLLIGISEYDDPRINDLDQPTKDVHKLFEVLNQNYGFTAATTVIQENPSREELIDTLDHLSDAVAPNDSLLIFYAGHGFWDEQFEQGYWLPRDAKPSAKASWISNATIRDYMKGIRTKHTLLISDACFSGGLFRTRSAFGAATKLTNVLFQLTSRKAITSGTLTEVPDKSIFLSYLVRQLQANGDSFLTSTELFNRFRIAVLNNSVLDQVPQHGVVQGAGDEGGDFIFVRH